MIKLHRWKCKKCEDKLFLRVDDSIPFDLERLELFLAYSSKHVIATGHEMIHTEKEDKGFRVI